MLSALLHKPLWLRHVDDHVQFVVKEGNFNVYLVHLQDHGGLIARMTRIVLNMATGANVSPKSTSYYVYFIITIHNRNLGLSLIYS